ncbi:arsenic resistance protein [Megalodesulfovibrio gigas]|uniref:Putative Bile acid:sodium symporter n=1 Tax=Megalodesulfovibrio gigas (strain ATCC 19364 / DSM 1382 / NCIMB 9332 / VKM B-1759) TaxID=1121448 RepID=T2GEK9_MEGG1|nr:bile acid:sodium symporter [Megalodesulfovibrio gigas]AGW14362.1 putative Bile acid:sodium symporter [Megalodesulfovibrio gigas DSM 1382 = ATCC 19364]
MWTLLQRISKNLILAIPAMMLLGLAYGLVADARWLKSLIIPFTFLMVYPMMVTLKIRQVFEGGDVKAQVAAQAINFLIIPFLTYGVGLLFFADQPYMALGLLLAGLVPTSGMTISWTGFAKGNVAAAVKMTVIGLTLGSLATPLYVMGLMGATIDVNIGMVLSQILLIVFLPMFLGYVTQQALVKRFGREAFQKNIGPRFPALSTLGVLGIVFVALALKAHTLVGSPGLLLRILLPLALLYSVNYVLSTFVARALLPRGDAIAMVYGTVMRNLSIALAIAINAFGEKGSDAALVVALAYIIQVQSAAWYVKYTDRVFGAAPQKPAMATAAAKA